MSQVTVIGSLPDHAGSHFRVWAPEARQVEVVLYADDSEQTVHTLAPEAAGYFAGHIAGVRAGARYLYRVDGGEPRPDPASRAQPDGPHGPSQVIDPAAFTWTDAGWRGVALTDLVIYELHVGTATPEGTFESLIARLADIHTLGATAIELMPVAGFPGHHNWGYDGVNIFAPTAAYGGPEGLRRLVDAAHALGLAVILDVVYNHLGPDGNYLRSFSPHYFTRRHTTPWGDAFNVDGEQSRPVRDFFIANALHWAHEYHLDGLRLDATHAILDDSPVHLLAELAEQVRESLPEGRHFLFIAENEHNDPQIVRPVSVGGWGLDAVWADDFHHQVRVALTGENDGYYADYSGSAADLAITMRQNWFYNGQPSRRRGKPRGAPAEDVEPQHFVYCIQNHDQVGNRALGQRLNHDVGLASYRAVSMLLLIAPQTPLLWMGQEWAASSPFLYFTDHHPELGRLVTEGRRKEFAAFSAFSGEQVPDPQAEQTFLRSKLRWEERETAPHRGVLQLYKDLLELRRNHPLLRSHSSATLHVAPLDEQAIVVQRSLPDSEHMLMMIMNLGGTDRFALTTSLTRHDKGFWRIMLSSEDKRYDGQGGCTLEGDELVFDGPGAVLLEHYQDEHGEKVWLP